MVIVEGTAVEPGGRITAGDLGLWDDATEAALVPILKAIRAQSKTAMAIQLAHAGRKGSSAVPWAGGGQVVLFRDLIDMPADVAITEREITVRFHRRAHLPIVLASGLFDKPVAVPWWNGRALRLVQ